MISITIPVGNRITYKVPSLDVAGEVQNVQIDLEDGVHTVASQEFNLGVIHGVESRALRGQLIFGYTYDEKERVVTVCGTNFESKDTMVLVTRPEGLNEFCVERTTGSTRDEEFLGNRVWNYRVRLMPGASTIFNRIVRGANDAMIAALKQQEGLTVQIRTPFPKDLPIETYLSLCTVHRNGQFLGMYDPSQDYGADVVIGGLESKWGGEVHMYKGENFANVIGSTKDPHIASKSWIALWAAQYGGYPNFCTSYQYGGFNCGDTFVGGHVIKGKTAKIVAAGSNSVYIYPICHAHNNNDSVYMAALVFLGGIWLVDYLH